MTWTALGLGLLSGFALASIYVLISLSFTLVLSASGVFNFAQGTLVMAGGIGGYLLADRFHWPVLSVVALVLAAGAAGGLLTNLIAVRPAIGRTRSFTHTTMLTTIGLGLAANAAVALFFGGDTQRVAPLVDDAPVMLGSIPLRPTYLIIIGTGLLVTVVIEIVMRRSRLGHVFRATLEDVEFARLQGIDTGKVVAGAFAIAGALSAMAGYLIAPVIGASAFAAQQLAFAGFAAMAIGGFGSFSGALIGGVIAGMVTGLTPLFSNPQASLPVLWLVIVAMLICRPGGLLGTAGLFGAARNREV